MLINSTERIKRGKFINYSIPLTNKATRMHIGKQQLHLGQELCDEKE